jgi:hypothetical protein
MNKSRVKEYRCWQNMKDRVLNPNHRYYEKYSKLGMYSGWVHDYDAFLAYIGSQPSKDTRWSVGRIDNTAGYFPGNVRWEDGYQQNRNRSMPKSNNSGSTGVTWKEEANRPSNRAIATWYDLNRGKQRSKSFSDAGIGKDAAIRLATEYRAVMIAELNSKGAEYADKHGLQEVEH